MLNITTSIISYFPIVSQYIISNQIKSNQSKAYHITSHHIKLHHIISYRLILYPILSYPSLAQPSLVYLSDLLSICFMLSFPSSYVQEIVSLLSTSQKHSSRINLIRSEFIILSFFLTIPWNGEIKSFATYRLFCSVTSSSLVSYFLLFSPLLLSSPLHPPPNTSCNFSIFPWRGADYRNSCCLLQSRTLPLMALSRNFHRRNLHTIPL